MYTANEALFIALDSTGKICANQINSGSLQKAKNKENIKTTKQNKWDWEGRETGAIKFHKHKRMTSQEFATENTADSRDAARFTQLAQKNDGNKVRWRRRASEFRASCQLEENCHLQWHDHKISVGQKWHNMFSLERKLWKTFTRSVHRSFTLKKLVVSWEGVGHDYKKYRNFFIVRFFLLYQYITLVHVR